MQVKNMKKIAVISTVLFLVLNTLIMGCLDTKELKTNVIVIDGKGEYSSIQNAIDNASKDDTIFVYDGNYYETLVVNKSIKLIGAGKEKPILIYNKKMVKQDFKKFYESLNNELIAIKDRVRNLIGDVHWGADGEHKEAILKN